MPNGDSLISVKTLELSGCAVVEGGLLIADDELVGSVLFLPTNADRSAEVVKVKRRRKQTTIYSPKLFAIQDFEGLASDGKRTVFLVGSHRSKKGRRTDREFLIQADWKPDPEDRELKCKAEHRDLLDRLHVLLCANDLWPPENGDAYIDVEGLALDPHGRLYIGLRYPLTPEGEAILIETDWALDEMVVRTLSLGGFGIRALGWGHSNGILVVSGPPDKEPVKESPAIWLWSPESDENNLRRIHTFEMVESREVAWPEGICRLSPSRVAVVFDSDSGQMPKIEYLELEIK